MINVDIEVYDMAVMDASAASFSTQDSDFSTGYLEDALVEFGESSKRRRLLSDDEQNKNTISIDDFDKVYIVEYVFFPFILSFKFLLFLEMRLINICNYIVLEFQPCMAPTSGKFLLHGSDRKDLWIFRYFSHMHY